MSHGWLPISSAVPVPELRERSMITDRKREREREKHTHTNTTHTHTHTHTHTQSEREPGRGHCFGLDVL